MHSLCEVIAHAGFLDLLPDSIGKREVGDKEYKATAGFPDSRGALIAFESLEASASGCKSGRYFAVTTAPISKAEMKKSGLILPAKRNFLPTGGGESLLWRSLESISY